MCCAYAAARPPQHRSRRRLSQRAHLFLFSFLLPSYFFAFFYIPNISIRDDLERAIQKLAILGGGYRVVMAGHRKLVQSVPVELNKDHFDVLERAQVC